MTIFPRNRRELREWYEVYSATEKEVWVRCGRGSHLICTGQDEPADNEESEPVLSYLDAVEEALCFGWIDSTTRSLPGQEGYLQRFSPRRKGSYWTELNKERCRRLIRLGLMTPAGRKVLPSLAKDSFKPDKWIIDAIKADEQAWKNHKTFHPLYVRVRLYNIMFYMNRNAQGDREKAMKMLDRYIKSTRDGKMIGDWNDGGRLLE